MSKSWQDRVVEGELRYHGYWHGSQLAADGSSPSSTIGELSIPSTFGSKSKVLILDPPIKWWKMHRVFLTLSVEHREVLIARYSVPPKEDGSMRTAVELAKVMKISIAEYRGRLGAAKRAYKRRVFDSS